MFLNHALTQAAAWKCQCFVDRIQSKTARTGQTVCPGLNSHPQPLQPWHWWGSSVLSQYQRCRAEGPARLWAEFCQLPVGHGTTQLCVLGACQPHSLLFSLAAQSQTPLGHHGQLLRQANPRLALPGAFTVNPSQGLGQG